MSEIDILKNEVVTEMFVDPADHDYVVSRWCYQNCLFGSFFWNAAQAIEKYLKASLLLNGRSSKKFGHDLVRLYDAVTEYADDLLPDGLERPEAFDGRPWLAETTPMAFISRLNEFGNPNNRYNMFGYDQRWSDLAHLDQIVWAIRRVTVGLDRGPVAGKPEQRPGVPSTNRELLAKHPRGRNSRLGRIASGKEGDALRAAALRLNFPFAPEDYEHDPTEFQPRAVAQESVLLRRILDRVPCAPDPVGAELAEWVLANIRLPEGKRADDGSATTVKHQIKDAAKALRPTKGGL